MALLIELSRLNEILSYLVILFSFMIFFIRPIIRSFNVNRGVEKINKTSITFIFCKAPALPLNLT